MKLSLHDDRDNFLSSTDPLLDFNDFFACRFLLF